MSTVIPSVDAIGAPPLSSPDAAVHTDTDPRPTVRDTVAYVAAWARYGRDILTYVEESHMLRVNQRIDAILGLNR